MKTNSNKYERVRFDLKLFKQNEKNTNIENPFFTIYTLTEIKKDIYIKYVESMGLFFNRFIKPFENQQIKIEIIKLHNKLIREV